MNEALKNIINQLSKYGFLKTSSETVNLLNFGPLSLFLAENIKREWFSNNVTSGIKSFSYESCPNNVWQEDCQTAFSKSLETTGKQLPFALDCISTSAPPTSLTKENESNAPAYQFSNTRIYSRLIFINQKDSQQYFYRLQRRRKIWWRKLSTDPDRYNVMDNEANGELESVQITASFPWATGVVEKILCHGCSPLLPYGKLFEVGKGRNKALPHVIENVCLEGPAVMTFLCDSYDQLPDRTILRLHRSLSPYQAAVLVDPPDDSIDNLHQLGAFINLTLKEAGLNIFPTSGQSADSLDDQLAYHDSVGVPYTVVARPGALVNGILALRSRDTTLEEQVHIARLASYMRRLSNIKP